MNRKADTAVGEGHGAAGSGRAWLGSAGLGMATNDRQSSDANPMPDVSVGSRQLVDVFHDWVSDFLVWLLGWLVR